MRRGWLVAALLLTAWPTAALADGWYALIPPASGGISTPLAQWEQVRAFDSAEQCEQRMMAYARQFADQTDNAARVRYQRVQYMRCVSAADPRLREGSR